MPRDKKTAKEALVIKIYNQEGKELELIALPKAVEEAKINPRSLAQYIRVYLANQRQGNAATKTRGEVIGSTRKIYKQKGTGRARHGDIKAPIFVGGGVVGGPQPHYLSLKINKKQRKKALLDSFILKYKQGDIIGLDDNIQDIEPKTKLFSNILRSLNVDHNKLLLILPKLKKNNLLLAARNMPNVTISQINTLNPYLLLKSPKILILHEALKFFIKHFKELA